MSVAHRVCIYKRTMRDKIFGMNDDFDVVIGAGLAAYRRHKNWRQEDLAERARAVGLQWTRATVAGVEKGRRKLNLDEAMLLQVAIRQPLARLLEAAESPINIASARIDGDIARRLLPASLRSEVLDWFAERAVVLAIDSTYEMSTAYKLTKDQAYKALASVGESEELLARNLTLGGLHVSAFEVACAASSLWHRSLGEERDRRVEESGHPGSKRVQAGHETRRLAVKIAERIREARAGQ